MFAKSSKSDSSVTKMPDEEAAPDVSLTVRDVTGETTVHEGVRPAETDVETFRAAVAGSDVTEAETAFNKAESVIRRVAGKGIMKSKTADRSISRMARSLNSLRASK